MTTAQDVIAEWLHQQYGDCFEHEHAGELIAALQGAPELARLELAALLYFDGALGAAGIQDNTNE